MIHQEQKISDKNYDSSRNLHFEKIYISDPKSKKTLHNMQSIIQPVPDLPNSIVRWGVWFSHQDIPGCRIDQKDTVWFIISQHCDVPSRTVVKHPSICGNCEPALECLLKFWKILIVDGDGNVFNRTLLIGNKMHKAITKVI